MSDLGNKEIFAKNLKYYMELNQKDRNDIAKDLNLPYTTVTSWYNGEFYPRIDKIQLLANYFGVQKADLVEEKQSTKKTNRIPVLGRIPAGVPLEMIEDILDYEELADDMLRGGKEYFALKVSGDSMYPEYLNGDVLIVLKQNDCESGQDCVVAVNGDDATFKRVYKLNGGITLQPLNNQYVPVFYSNEDILNKPVKILGIVKQIRRDK